MAAVGFASVIFPAVARAAPVLDCPAGTTQRRQFYADEFWCARPDGIRHGPYRNGWTSPTEAGAYRDGKRDGWWRRWAEGVLVDERRYDRDREDGLARTWSPGGVLLSSGRMSHGNEVGLWRSWYDSGRLQSVGRYERGKKVGLWRSWFASGRRGSAGRYEAGRPVGRHVEWDQDGNVLSAGSYRKGKRDGIWIEAQGDDPQIGRGRYVRDRREGQWVFTYENRRSAVGGYHLGWREGDWTLYAIYGDGVDARGRYHQGRKDGIWVVHNRHYLTDTAIASCRMGEPHGRFVWRQEGSGRDKVVGYEIVAHYNRGSLEGRWTERYPRHAHPESVEHGLYRFGHLVSGDAFDVAEVLWMEDGSSGVEVCEEAYDDLHAFGDRDPPDRDDDG